MSDTIPQIISVELSPPLACKLRTNFNPSIVRIPNTDKYLVSYRSFYRSLEHPGIVVNDAHTDSTSRVHTGSTSRVHTGSTSRVHTDSTSRVHTGSTSRVYTGTSYNGLTISEAHTSSNSPWYGGIRSELYWDKCNGEDVTKFIILDIDTLSIKELPQELNTRDVRLTLGYHPGILNPVILATGTGTINNKDAASLYGQFHGYDRLKYKLYPITHLVYSELIHITPLYIKDELLQIPANKGGSVLCYNIASAKEKNWSLWTYKGVTYTSYILHPYHMVLDITAPLLHGTPRKLGTTQFQRIVQYYNHTLYFSLSTPALPFLNNKYLGIGHSKLIHDDPKSIANIIPPHLQHKIYYDTLLDNAKKLEPLIQNRVCHPAKFGYFMFFYTFDPETLNIESISHSYIPSNCPYLVVFPSGLETYKDGYIVAYGEGDHKMKLLFISTKAICNLLHANIEPQDYKFTILDVLSKE